ncbi:isotrichodermin C-15 hydroxylase [Diplogelasinospora grovesii]|uniref:Isotrichodermin C-15 hydroxylase n=1 Tax=Diplogelasinospora grovesii TaxID=303347 RepID=A0AAN6NBM7_9PEZI|nr:isotrichodermin C-15 hydroxylase [Diplogelasinospora grovesii]
MAVLETLLGAGASSPWLCYSGVVVASILIWHASKMAYNLFLHPLRKFPGPVLQRASGIPWAVRHSSGTQAFHTQKLHDIYGPVVRIGPNHLTFTDVRAWKDIYGHLVGTKSSAPEMDKTDTFGRTLDDIPHSIVNAHREEHQRFRRALSHGFSDASMRQQEPMIVKYVDLLLRRLHGEAAGNKALNMEAWYNWTTFDIAGDLIFGQSFGSLQGSEYHPWIEFILKTVKWGAVMIAMSYVGLHWLVQFIFRNAGFLAVKKVQGYTDAMVSDRLKLEPGRPDLFEGLVKHKEEWDLSFEKLSANAFLLVLAGSETTATTLSGVTYLLLTHPDVMERLKKEVRSSFTGAEEITISSVSKLTYMLAVLNEALRLYPPVTSSLVRQVPREGAMVAGHWVPGGTFVEIQHWSMNHSKENWRDPWAFQPERFLSDPKKASEEGNRLEALQAFSTGPRNCIGRNLAYAEMRLILARIMYDFDMRLADDSKQWIERQKAYSLWDRIPLHVYLAPVRPDRDSLEQ